MHAESFPPNEDEPEALSERDAPPDQTPEAPRRRPIISLFTRRAFLSKDTGRWHKLTGGRDHRDDEPADTPGTGGSR
jgi:hypothetical protein